MAGPRYIADTAELTRSVELEALSALYHRPSGMTHILAPPAPQILAALAERAGDAAEVLARIGDAFEVEAADPEAVIEARLGELEAAGLVRRA